MEQVGANHGNQTATTAPAAAAVVNGGGKKGNEGQNSLGEGNAARAASATQKNVNSGGTIGQGTGADPKGSVPTPPVFVITSSSSSNYVSGEKSSGRGSPSNNKSSTLSNAVGLPSHSVRDASSSSSPVVIAQEEDPGEPPAKTSQRPSNPRQSTLTRSHAITLDEDSDGQEHVGGGIETETQHEEQLIQFLIETCNKSSKDRNFVLRIEADLVQFVKDSTRQTLPFPQMSSYQRMLVHRMATLFDLDHNVDNSTGGNFVVVSKDLSNKNSRQGQLPSIRFKELLSSPVLVPSHSQEDSAVPDSTTGKKILKREKPQNLDKNRPLASKTKSLEERTQDYHKARRRIFEESGGSVDSIENTNPSVSGFSNKKLNWSSTDSSEDRMYLKPPFPSSGKLIKVESFESASQRKPSNRDSRQMGKSHSFGGYEDSGQQPTHPPHAQSYKRTSNNASSSMISCSSSSSIRSSSFSKQDSSSSTTSGSGQSPSGGTSSSGYKSGGSGDRGIRGQGTVVYGQQQSYTTLPVVHSPQVQEQEQGTTASQSQQVMFCCWAVADVNNVPPGAIIIDPNTHQAVKNTDGSQYYYDPQNPPKFVGGQNPGTPAPPMEYYSNTVQYGSVQACASVPPPPPPPASQTIMSQPPPPPPQYIQYTQETSPQQTTTHDLSSYFSNLSLSSNAQRLAPTQVIYVPVDAVNTTYGNAAAPSDPSNTGQVVYYEVDASNVQVQQAPPQNQSQGYVFQNIENTGSQAPVYYYGSNLVNTNSQQPVNLSPMQRGDVPVGASQPPPQFQQPQQQQQRVKNWVLPSTNVLMHTAPHSMAYAGGNASQQGGMVQVPTLQPPTHVAPQQQQQQQQPGPGALVPLGYHSQQQQQSAPTTPHTIMHSLVPVQNPVQFPQPPVSSYVPVQSTPHYAPPPNYSTSMSSTPHQSFVPQPMNPQQRTFVPQSTTPQPPRFIMPSTAAAAVAHQQQIFFAAAAAAAAMGFSNTPFSNYTPTSSASAPGSTVGGRGRGIVHGSVTGAHVVRRPAAPKTFVNKNNVQK